jgi:hypothetical protein
MEPFSCLKTAKILLLCWSAFRSLQRKVQCSCRRVHKTAILPVVMCGCRTCSLTLKEKKRNENIVEQGAEKNI